MENPLTEQCPICYTDLRGAPIPDTDPVRYYSHLIGVEIPWIYDGTLYYECPFCNSRFHRFNIETHAELWHKAHPYVRNLTPKEVMPLKTRGRVRLSDDLALVYVHNPASCAGEYCAIHNPSHHPLCKSPRTFTNGLVQRVCSHSVAHPDPDALAWLKRTISWATAEHRAVHTCCPEKCCESTIEKTSK